MSVKNCGVDIEVTSLQDQINILADEVNDLNNELVIDKGLIQANGANIAQLNTNLLKIGGIYGVPVYAWSTQDAGYISIPKTTGTWIGCFNDINLNLPVSGTYMVSLNFMTFMNNDNIGHNPITVGCELFQDNIGLVTNFTSSCGVTTSYPIKDTGTSFDGLYGFGVNMSFPVVIGDPSLPFSLSLYFFFNNDSDQTIQIRNGCPNSGSPLDWWRDTINTGNSFSMTLLSTDSI